ncbi:MAG: adenosylmethionine--8-amino-7-oxononanoate transaminase [Brevinematales bacterium]|nr:adenosylmethionine--8-amino-7-oxononanoate transaminase [Brevinematales bacterium]
MTPWNERDLAVIWHPCTQMKDHETFPPLVIERGEGVWLYDIHGKRYLDAISSWWVNLFGHARQEIADAIAQQAHTLEQVIFSHFSHTPAIMLAERLVHKAPSGLSKVFFSDNGSTAVEVALKMSFQYHRQTNNPQKHLFVKLTDAYHGETVGALSVGDISLYREIFHPLLFATVTVEGPDCYRCPYGKNRDTCEVECFEKMAQALTIWGDEVAAVIIEPLVQAAAGMKMYPPLYLKKLREITSSLDIHLIADEVAVGFGRTGTFFACEQAEISPDFLCLSKGLTGGFLPMGLTLTTENIYQAFYDDYKSLRAFMHSHSYTGNPLACAAALATLNLFDTTQVLKENISKSTFLFQQASTSLANLEMIGEYRQRGMIGAIELVEDKKTKKTFDWEKRIGYRIYRRALDKGLLLRPLGNILYFMPPYNINYEEIQWMVETAVTSISEFFTQERDW